MSLFSSGKICYTSSNRVFPAVWAFLQLWQAHAFHCGGFSCCRAQALGLVGFSRCGSQAVEQGQVNSCRAWLRCSTVCEIFPDQGLKPCLLRWQVTSLPLIHQGSPLITLNTSVKVLLTFWETKAAFVLTTGFFPLLSELVLS